MQTASRFILMLSCCVAFAGSAQAGGFFRADLSDAENAPAFGVPEELFTGNYVADSVVGRSYDVSADSQRFLMIRPGAGEPEIPPVVILVQNWFEELKRLVPID